MDSNVTELNSRRGRRESVSDADIDAVIEQLMADLEGVLPSGEAVYEIVGSARTRCFARLKYWQRQGEAQRLENPGQLPTAVLDGLQLVMTRLEQDVQARLAHRETEWELEKIALKQQIAEAKKAEIAETYRREDLEKQLAAVEHQLVASQADNRHLRERNEALHQYNEQHKAEAHAAQQIADDRGKELAASRATRQQLENALEASRVSVAALQSENRALQTDQAQLQVQIHDLSAQTHVQRQLQQTARWHQQIQHHEKTIAVLEARTAQDEHDRETLERQLQLLQDHVAALSSILEARSEITPESIKALLRAELKAMATHHSTAHTDDWPVWRQACAKALQAILDTAGVTPEELGSNSSAAQRILAQEGTEHDIAALFEPRQGRPEGKMTDVLQVCPDMAAFMRQLRHWIG